MSSKQFPIMNRVTEVLHRMDDNSSQPDAMKTCFGILAIMSREDVNKLLIARDGMETILNVMTQHVDKTDIQESGCDLIWSLAFNNAAVKETIAKHGGASVLVRALKRHSKSPEFLKSACGALSNMCQSRMNQEGIASQGGLQPLVGSIHVHQNNSKLLPFVFDALASLIVSNEENARTVSSLGIIPLIVSSLARHKSAMEVVKSGCHALAILSDVKGQASKIAFAGGVAIILSLLDVHPSYADLHRVAAVVILRMLQESTHVGREITCNDGVRIFLKSLERGGAQQDTVAAVTHILFTVTNPSSPSSSNIESQLWITPKDTDDDNNKNNRKSKGSEKSSRNDKGGSDSNSGSSSSSTALGGLVNILGQYCDRRDVVRAACRLLNNLGGFPGVIVALEKLNVLDRVLTCVNNHGETRDVVDSTAAILKAIHRRSIPSISTNPSCMNGLLHVLNNKVHDEDVILAATEIIAKFIEQNMKTLNTLIDFDPKRNNDNGSSSNNSSSKIWEHESLRLSVKILERISGSVESNSGNGSPTNTTTTAAAATGARDSPSIIKMQHSRKSIYNKNTPRVLVSIMTLVELYYSSNKVDYDSDISKALSRGLNNILDTMPNRTIDVAKRIEKIVNIVKKKSNFGLSGGDDDGVLKEDDESTGKIGSSDHIKGNKNSSAMSRRGRDISNKKKDTQQLTYPMYISSSGYAIPKVWRTEGDENKYADENDSNGASIAKRLLPLHPLNYFTKQPGVPDHEIPRLLDTWPSYLERLVMNTSTSYSNMGGGMMGDRMHIVYEGGSAAGKEIQSRCTTPVPYNVPINGSGPPFEHSLSFDSEFESGNMLRVIQRGDANYDMFLRSDLHTGGHTQWFYFAVSNTHPAALVRLAEQGVQVPPVRVRFNIVNLTKPDSLFNLGMRPVVYSCLDAATKNIGWVRGGSDISYYSNSYARQNMQGEGLACYYTLTFTLEFQYAKDTTLVAYSYPYTYSDYRSHISKILSRPGSADIIRQSRLCHTLSGEETDLLVITDYKAKDKDRIGPTTLASAETYRSDEAQRRVGGTMGRSGKTTEANKQPLKQAFFLSCRVHPGETPASWMMKGALDFLTSDCPQARLLRTAYVIFVVPMLNPDGVIFGNNRCSLAGVDLNRQWKIPMKGLHPTVYHLKALMQAQRRLRECALYVDLHGHSRKYNVFLYGCDEKKKPKPQVRAFPRFFSMHHVGKKYVSFSDCSFHVRKGRESTARVVVAKDLQIPCSFTLEATFCGSNFGPLKNCHMHVGHLQETGASMCDAILNFLISEGKINDCMQVPANVRAAAQIELAIAEEDGTSNNGQANNIMHDNASAFSNANVAHQMQTGFNITPGNSNTFSGAAAAGSGTGTSAGTVSSSSSSGYAELRNPVANGTTKASSNSKTGSISNSARGTGMGTDNNSSGPSSRRNSKSSEILDMGTNMAASSNAADAAALDSDSDAPGGDSDLDSLVGTGQTRIIDVGDTTGISGDVAKARNGGLFNRSNSNSSISSIEGQVHPQDGANTDMKSAAQRGTMPTLSGVNKTIGISNLANAGLSSTLSIEANSNSNGKSSSNLPQPPRDGMFVPTASGDSSMIIAVPSSNSGGGPKKRVAKDDSALTRSGYRVLDGMAAVGSSTLGSSNHTNTVQSSPKMSTGKKKKSGSMKTSSSAKSSRSRSKDIGSETFSSLSTTDRPNSLPKL
jgi:cytosolic carboxypeptidase protein 2/3